MRNAGPEIKILQSFVGFLLIPIFHSRERERERVVREWSVDRRRRFWGCFLVNEISRTPEFPYKPLWKVSLLFYFISYFSFYFPFLFPFWDFLCGDFSSFLILSVSGKCCEILGFRKSLVWIPKGNCYYFLGVKLWKLLPFFFF